MFKKALFLSLVSSVVFAEAPPPMPPSMSSPIGMNKEGGIVVNNRILLKVNGKPLTVVDVVKKMDILFYRQFPHLLVSPMARYEFYCKNFRMIFSSLVNDLLVVADAEEKEVVITDGDVREEMEKFFGPDVVGNIDKIGLGYDEAWDLMKRELVVRRMTQMMVRSKAICEVQPKEIKTLYEKYVKEHPPEMEWHYHVLTIRGKEQEKVIEASEKVYQKLLEQGALSKNAHVLSEEMGMAFSYSEEYVRRDKEISETHKKILQALSPMSYSKPHLQTNASGEEHIAKIFFLKDYKQNTSSSFQELEDKLQGELLQKAIARHGEYYSEKLKDRYGITNEYLSQMIPPDFEPFAMK